MSTPTSTGSGGRAGETADAAKESGQAVADSAANHARDLAATASDKASDVLGEAKSQASDLLGTAREQVGAEAEHRRDQAVTSLRSLGGELDSMQSHDGDKGFATQLASRGGEYARQTADWLDGREPSQILDDVRRFARERPGTFLLGALLAGVVAGRFTRAVKAGAPAGPAPAAAAQPRQAAASTIVTPTVARTPAMDPVAAGGEPASYDDGGYPHVGDDLASRPGTS